jgi:RNA polymerase sigma-70 factor (ECF subfamily)
MDSEERVDRDRLLRNAVLRGDQRAWQTWVNETFDDLCGYVRWRCGGVRDRADEVVQETWLTAARRLRRFNPAKGTFLAWLRGIASNVLRNQLRRRTRAAESLRGDPTSAADQPALEEQERAERIAAVLCELPERHEAVLRAKYFEGLSVDEIAELRVETPKAIESLLTRARKGFREAYRKYERNGRLR